MKVFLPVLLAITIGLCNLSCQRELFFDRDSIGMLKKDTSGNCLPVIAAGNYETDSLLNNNNFIDVGVDVFFRGEFNISSDTINGYYFQQAGIVEKGSHSIRLFGHGKPVHAADNCFIIRYGASTCTICIKVAGPHAAEYTLAGAPDLCTGIYVDGTYIVGKTLNASNILTVQALVTHTGSYSITASTTNGFSFSDTGIFTVTGLQNVILKGTGKPIRDEGSDVTVSNTLSHCKLAVTVLSDTAGKALFTYNGAPGECISYILNGNYYAGVATSVANTVLVYVNVSKPGSYDIITNTENGLTYSCSGSFSNLGQQALILTAKGTPLRVETTAFIPNTGTVSCYFYINVQPLPPPATFTLAGAPGNCTPATINGFYILLKPLDGANTVLIQVDVATAGSYTISSNTLNGMSFSASGIFTTTGLQNVTLKGSGIPQATGSYVFTPRYIASACNFSVSVQ